jgi:hypothetical protein
MGTYWASIGGTLALIDIKEIEDNSGRAGGFGLPLRSKRYPERYYPRRRSPIRNIMCGICVPTRFEACYPTCVGRWTALSGSPKLKTVLAKR